MISHDFQCVAVQNDIVAQNCPDLRQYSISQGIQINFSRNSNSTPIALVFESRQWQNYGYSYESLFLRLAIVRCDSIFLPDRFQGLPKEFTSGLIQDLVFSPIFFT
jgi:hypothetical protein